jgi:ornithine cyclodeaminase/alanine dehydrogenase-like protein (mu-crystallin family)
LKTTVYSVEDIRTIVRHVGLDRIMDEAIEMLHEQLDAYQPDTHVIPIREGFEYTEPEIGLIEWMPAMQNGSNVTIKVVGYHPHNPQGQSLPTIMSTVFSFDTKNGHLLSVIDGNLITAIRTGAASAVASRILARPDSRTLGLIGCGAQAISQLHALSRVFDLRQILIYDTDLSTQSSFPRRASCLGLDDVEIIPVPLDHMISKVDILCTATSIAVGTGPVFNDTGIRESAHINAIGSDFPGKIEIPESLLKRSLVVPDFMPQAVREGECQHLQEDQIGPDLVELVKARGHYSSFQNSCTVFDSTGWALEDHVTVELFANYGQELGCGTEITLGNVVQDPRNPYASLGALRGVVKNAV